MTNYLRKIGKSGKVTNRRTYMNSKCTSKYPIILIIGLKIMVQKISLINMTSSTPSTKRILNEYTDQKKTIEKYTMIYQKYLSPCKMHIK